MHQRVILIGPTGIGKNSVAKAINEHIKKEHQHEFRIVDFEKDYLAKNTNFGNWPGFLTEKINIQYQIWRDSWKEFSKSLNPADSKQTILLLHSSYVREMYGIRSVLDINSICVDFQPTLIITLFNDIFNMWWKTEQESKGELFIGRPTYEQLLLARRTEMLLGDLIAFQSSLRQPARHIICSICHPIEVISNIIFNNSKIVYMSFPISEPRKMFEKGDNFFVNEINRLHNMALDQMKKDPSLVYISPLAIDELPFYYTAERAIKNGQEKFEFDMNKRWSLNDLWSNCELICRYFPDPVEVPVSKIKNIYGLIYTDVGWRDYKLVSQSNALIIFCPIPKGRNDITSGVKGEWQMAVNERKYCYVYQKPEWDPDNILNNYIGDPGTMGSQPMSTVSHRVLSMEELFQRCKSIK